MNYASCTGAIAGLTLGLASWQAHAAIPVGYKILDLGPGAFSGTPTTPSINNAGQVALGTASAAAIWSNGSFTTLAGPADARAFFVSEAGMAVGGRGGALSPVRWVGGVMEDLGNLVPGTGDLACDVNSTDVIAITTSTGGYLLNGSAASPTGLRRAEGLNNAGVAVGNLFGGSGFVAASSTGGVATPLAGVPSDSLAMDINESGAIVGHYQSASMRRPFRWANGSWAALPVLSTSAPTLAMSISDGGDAVGYSLTPSPKALIWSGSEVYDLQTLLSDGAGWVLQGATSINASGQIVGSGTLNGEQRIFLLTPIPAPGTAVIGVIVVATAGARRRR